MPTTPIEAPPAYHPPAPTSGPIFTDDAPTERSAPTSTPLPSYAGPPPVAPAPPIPPAELPVAQSQPAPRRGTVLVLVIAAVLAALIGAVGVVFVLGGEKDEGADDTAADDRPVDPGDRPDAAEASDAGATASAPAADPTTAVPRTFRCWDGGAAVTELASCARPTGVDGMAWVFPSSAGSGCYSGVGVRRPTEVDCAPTIGGAAVRFHYSEWRTRGALERYYGGITLAPIAAPDGRTDLEALQVVSRDSDVGYKVAIYHAAPTGLWSVTIYATDRAQYDAALRELQVRPIAQLRGKRS
ncbi:hypothetical protein [Nocardioides pelophilus]|uniref:hypothetical protein n=1 Tax=Nocardioides pelophilus TaxID=2172019 RepID=UPI0016048C7D|nr:hypothetical protein [Nocardioides pelophilus]